MKVQDFTLTAWSEEILANCPSRRCKEPLSFPNGISLADLEGQLRQHLRRHHADGR